ncbi:MAG: HAD hydrolase-like protein, partial [Kangiella sp.]|nr:HAD hydrolase-like protein [Kangiella sp.]
MKRQLLICDLDNTLYDWVDYIVTSLYAMLAKTQEITGWDRETLLNDLKIVHQRHHDSEHPFALLETELVRKQFGENGQSIAKRSLDEAFHAFNSERKARLKTFPLVHETLDKLRRSNVALVAHTEAKFHAVADRLRRLNLIDHFERVFCRERSQVQHPDGKSISEWLDDFPVD